MPYIKKFNREDFKHVLETFDGFIESSCNIQPLTAGELNFLFTSFLVKVLGDNPNYARYNEMIGMLECCKLELYRRRVAEYENEKIRENGDVY